MSLALQLLASLSTIVAWWLVGSKNPKAPFVALASELIWLAMIVLEGLWGLLPLVVVLLAIHVRNINKWFTDWVVPDGKTY